MKKKIISIVLIVTLLGVFAGCGKSESSASSKDNSAAAESGKDSTSEKDEFEGEGLNEADTVRIAVNGVTSIEYAYEKKYHWIENAFHEAGVKVEFTQFEYGAPVVEAIAAGDIDVTTAIGDTPFLTAYANGVGIEAIYALPSDPKGMGLIVSPEQADKITKLEDLKGKKIAVAVGSAGHDFILKELESVGLSENDVEIVNIGTANEMLSALLANEVDVVQYIEPTCSSFVAKGGTRLDYGEALKESISLIVASTEFTEKNPKLTAVYDKVIDKLYNYILENPEETKEIYSELSGFDVSVLETYDRLEAKNGFDDKLVKGLEGSVDYLVKSGILDDKISLDGAYTDKYYEEAKRLEKEEK